MSFLNHQSTGAAGLRIAASVCVILAWISVIVALFMILFGYDFVILLLGVGACAILYLAACSIRALASMAEAAELYYSNNAAQQYDSDGSQDVYDGFDD